MKDIRILIGDDGDLSLDNNRLMWVDNNIWYEGVDYQYEWLYFSFYSLVQKSFRFGIKILYQRMK